MQIEPNFDGEEMKLPNGAVSKSVTEAPASTLPGFGVIIGGLFILLVLICGGLAYWYFMVMPPTPAPTVPLRPTPEMNNEPESTTAEAQAESLGVVSTSDEIDALEADLESTNLGSLDAELSAIEAEMEAALQVQNP
jgi:hypothetical protein